MNIMNNPNKSNDSQDAWIKSAVSELDSSVENMDAIDASRLRTARQMAYREAEAQRQKGWASGFNDWLNWKSGLTLACTIAVVATITLNLNLDQKAPPELIAKTTQPFTQKVKIEEIPLLTAKEDLEFYESVNFLLWLEDKQSQS